MRKSGLVLMWFCVAVAVGAFANMVWCVTLDEPVLALVNLFWFIVMVYTANAMRRTLRDLYPRP